MIKDYLSELLLENDETLEEYEKQMKDLLSDLDGAKSWLETLQIEKNADTNIFSPRAMDPDIQNKIESARANIRKINQDIEYVRGFIETHVKKREEYQKLLDELNQIESTSSDDSKTQASAGIPADISDVENADLPIGETDYAEGTDSPIQNADDTKNTMSQLPDADSVKEPESQMQSEDNVSEMNSQVQTTESAPQSSDTDENSAEISDIMLDENSVIVSKEFLSQIYKKAEISLALLNSDRRRCKKELRALMDMIKDAAK